MVHNGHWLWKPIWLCCMYSGGGKWGWLLVSYPWSLTQSPAMIGHIYLSIYSDAKKAITSIQGFGGWCSWTTSGQSRNFHVNINIMKSNYYMYFWAYTNTGTVIPVFQIEPVLPSETDKRTCGRTNIGSSPPCRACSHEYASFWIFQIELLLREMWPFLWIKVKIQLLHFFIWMTDDVWADHFSCGWTTFEGSPSCGRVTILTSLEHW